MPSRFPLKESRKRIVKHLRSFQFDKPYTRVLLPVEPTYDMLKALAGDPLILAASDRDELCRRWAEMLKLVPKRAP